MQRGQQVRVEPVDEHLLHQGGVTGGLRGLAPDPDTAGHLVRAPGRAVPRGRPGQPAEVASAVLFPASGQSSFVTGSELFADGGDEPR